MEGERCQRPNIENLGKVAYLLQMGEQQSGITVNPRSDNQGEQLATSVHQRAGKVLAMKRPVRKIAFVSPHCVLDFTNGAATATLDGLALLARSGFACQAFCSSRMDAWEEVLVEEILARRGVRYLVRNAQIGAYRGRMIFTSHGPVPVTLFNSASTRGGWINRGGNRGLPHGMRDFPAQEPAGPGVDLRRRPGFLCRAQAGQATGHPHPLRLAQLRLSRRRPCSRWSTT